MTLTATTVRVQYNGDGSTTVFPITFIFWDLDDLTVVHTDSSGTETTWTRGTQYTATGGSGSTGTLTVVTTPTDYTPAAGETLTIKSNLPNTQPTDIPLGGAFPSQSVEQQLDQIVRQGQQRDETLDRSLHFPISDSSTISAEIPNAATRADNLLGFTSAGVPTAVAQSDQSATSVTAAGSTSSRLLSNWFTDWGENVLAHGADSGGTTDSLSAFDEAWTRAKATGSKCIYIPPGTYLLSGSWDIDAVDAVIYAADYRTATLKATDSSATVNITVNSAIVSGITFDGDSLATRGIQSSGARLRMYGVNAVNCTAENIRVGGDNSTLVDCRSKTAGRRSGATPTDFDAYCVLFDSGNEAQIIGGEYAGSTGYIFKITNETHVRMNGGRANFGYDGVVLVNKKSTFTMTGGYLEGPGAVDDSAATNNNSQTVLCDNGEVTLVGLDRLTLAKSRYGLASINNGKIQVRNLNRVHGIWESSTPEAIFVSSPGELALRVTGSITTGTPDLTVTHLGPLRVGHKVRVPGAGAASADLEAQIDAISGTAVSLDTNAGTTVSTQTITLLSPDPAIDFAGTGSISSGANTLTLSQAETDLERYDEITVAGAGAAAALLEVYPVDGFTGTSVTVSKDAGTTDICRAPAGALQIST